MLNFVKVLEASVKIGFVAKHSQSLFDKLKAVSIVLKLFNYFFIEI
jgi:hypothetical protein